MRLIRFSQLEMIVPSVGMGTERGTLRVAFR